MDYPFPLLSGLPPTRIYVHPDEQAAHLSLVGRLRRELSQAQKLAVAKQKTICSRTEDAKSTTDRGSSSGSTAPSTESAVDNNAGLQRSYEAEVSTLQAQITAAEHAYNAPQREWVLPTHLREKWSLRRFAAVFDSLSEGTPPTSQAEPGYELQRSTDEDLHGNPGFEQGQSESSKLESNGVGTGKGTEDIGMEIGEPGASADSLAQKKGKRWNKRLLLATLSDDSTVVYYVMHEGLVKPRQN